MHTHYKFGTSLVAWKLSYLRTNMDSDPDIGTGSASSQADSDSSHTPTPEDMSADAEEYERDRAAEFAEDIRRVSRNLLFLRLEQVRLQQGKGRRQVSGIRGQLMRNHADLPLGVLRDRLEPRLPASSRQTLNTQLCLLHRNWNRDLLANDRIFVDAMGSLDDPNHSRLEQYFSMLLRNECLGSGLSDEDSRMVRNAVCRCARHFMCQRFSEFCMRTLGQNGRRLFLQWVTGYRMQHRRERET